jgi:hypothetical protein
LTPLHLSIIFQLPTNKIATQTFLQQQLGNRMCKVADNYAAAPTVRTGKWLVVHQEKFHEAKIDNGCSPAFAFKTRLLKKPNKVYQSTSE